MESGGGGVQMTSGPPWVNLLRQIAWSSEGYVRIATASYQN